MHKRMTDKAWKELPIDHAAVCQNCDWRGHYEDLDPIKDFWERTEEGDIVWAGDCPECGAMSFTAAEITRQNNVARAEHDARALFIALENLMTAMETPRSRKAAEAWDSARTMLIGKK